MRYFPTLKLEKIKISKGLKTQFRESMRKDYVNGV